VSDETPEERARRVLVGTTPGPWTLVADTPWGSKVILNESGEMYLGVSATTSPPGDGWSAEARERAHVLGGRKCADARLIASAPVLIADLLAELDRLRHGGKELREWLTKAVGWAETLDGWLAGERGYKGHPYEETVELRAVLAALDTEEDTEQ
jgi:hypothetical protein